MVGLVVLTQAQKIQIRERIFFISHICAGLGPKCTT